MIISSSLYDYIVKNIDIIEVNGTTWVNERIILEQSGEYEYILQSKEEENT